MAKLFLFNHSHFILHNLKIVLWFIIILISILWVNVDGALFNKNELKKENN